MKVKHKHGLIKVSPTEMKKIREQGYLDVYVNGKTKRFYEKDLLYSLEDIERVERENPSIFNKGNIN